MEWLIQQACSFDDSARGFLGLSPRQFALVSAVATAALALSFLPVWLFMFGRLRRAGFGRRQQQLVWWYIFTVPLVQIALTFLAAEGVVLIACPWSQLASVGVTIVFLAMAFGFHVQDENRASPVKFVSMIAMPVLGEVVITSKAVVSAAARVAVLLLDP
jgi:hypothetical protein